MQRKEKNGDYLNFHFEVEMNMGTFFTIYLIFIVGIFLATIKYFGNVSVTPRQIYECNDLNMFACVLLFLIFIILDPLFLLAHFLYWVFHVGRKN